MPDAATQTTTSTTTTDAGASTTDAQTSGTDSRTFTQAELDRIVTERLNRQKGQFEGLAEKARKFDEAEAARLSESERLTNELRDAKAAGETAIKAANTRLITAEAKVQATVLGVKPDRVAAALKLADLSAVTVGEDGEPDAKAVKAAIEQVLADVPELKAAATGGTTSTANPARGAGGATNPWAKETLNLTEQGRIARENPTLAQQLRAAAGR